MDLIARAIEDYSARFENLDSILSSV
jgi:hypothetical protein